MKRRTYSAILVGLGALSLLVWRWAGTETDAAPSQVRASPESQSLLLQPVPPTPEPPETIFDHGHHVPDDRQTVNPKSHASTIDSVHEQPGEVARKLWTLSGSMSPTARNQYLDYIDALVEDRSASAATIHRELATLQAASRFGFQGRMLVHALGHVAHKTSIPVLEEILDEPLPQPSPGDEFLDPRAEMVLTKATAIRTLHAIANRYYEPIVVSQIVDDLEAVIADEGGSRHLKLVAADVLLSHSASPNERTEELAVLMGPDGDILRNLRPRPLSSAKDPKP